MKENEVGFSFCHEFLCSDQSLTSHILLGLRYPTKKFCALNCLVSFRLNKVLSIIAIFAFCAWYQ